MNRNTNRKVKVSVFHLTAFLFVYFINILLFFAFRSFLFLVTGVLLTVLAPLSFYMAWRLAEYVEGNILLEKEKVRQGEEAEVIFSVTNRSFLCALHGTWLLTIGNSFYQTFDSQKLLFAIPPLGKKQFQMTVTLTELGRIVFACKEFVITELLGIFEIHTDALLEGSLYVLPQLTGVKQEALPDAYSGAAELSESTRKGNDHSEVSDIRTYRPGDRPRDIHWKLSARQPELMVKERISLSGSEHILLLELPDERKKAERLLTEGYHKVKGLLDRHMTVRLLVWNNHLFSFDGYSCSCAEELEAAFCEIFHTDLLSHTSDMQHQYMKNCYPQLESYLCVAQKEETIQLEICVNG